MSLSVSSDSVKRIAGRPGPLECWEYSGCDRSGCIAYTHHKGEFYLYGERTHCGIQLYEESFGEYFFKMANLILARTSRAITAPVFAILGR